MEAPAVAVAEEVLEITPWDEDILDLLAFELWQHASCPEGGSEEVWEEVEPWCHASCL